MTGRGHNSSVTQSRNALLAEIGDASDLTFVRGIGNRGDELIWAGTRELLRGRPYRELGLDDLPASSGGTVLLSGGGAFCRPYNDYMPEALAVAELRFDRVIVLPTTFDVSVARVREALERTSATVFAREEESLRAIEGLCRARLAHDCAFFYDFSGRRAPGSGTLNAFRTDAERAATAPVLPRNDDISLTAGSLDEWLGAIERSETVRTDRAHVLIAAALMGKRVEYAPSSYFKVPAIARTWLRDLPVTPIDAEPPPAAPPIPDPARPDLVVVADEGAAAEPGAIEALAADLDAHPEAIAVTPLVLGADGAVRHFGGSFAERDGQVDFTPDSRHGASGPTGWLPPGLAVVRRDDLGELVPDPEPYGREEWSLAAQRARSGSLRRCREAVVAYDPPEPIPAQGFVEHARMARRLAGQARFYRRHGLLVGEPPSDPAAARLLMELVDARGPAWTVIQLAGGGLDPLLREPVAVNGANDHGDHEPLLAWLRERNETLARIEAGGWWRLRSRVLPALRALERVRGR